MNDGYSGLFWFMLIVGIVGMVGFIAVCSTIP